MSATLETTANAPPDANRRQPPWSIRVPAEVRQRATSAAAAADQEIGEWLCDAVESWARQQNMTTVIPPVIPQDRPESDQPAPEPETPPIEALDLHGLADSLSAIIRGCHDAGMKPPRALLREAQAAVKMHLRTMRGMASGHTKRKSGHTGLLLEGAQSDG